MTNQLKPEDGAIVIQARVGSTRLPGKSLAIIAGRPSLKLLLERIDGCRIGRTVVATSDRVLDDSIQTVTEMHSGIDLIRGSELDVLSRFETAIEQWAPKFVVRLTADNPAVDAHSIDIAVNEYIRRANTIDHIGNHIPVRTDPFGLGVEISASDALLEVARTRQEPDFREHVTLALIKLDEFRAESFRICEEDYSELCWTVDTWEQLVAARARFSACGPYASISELAEFDRSSGNYPPR